MRIILSPAKKMRYDENGPAYRDLPVFLSDAEKIKASLKEKSFSELKALWACNEKITEQNIERLSSMDLREKLAPAILSYDGIAYQYMAPTVFETEMLCYVQEHLRILSGFYGILKPMDGVTAYRLEMQAKLALCGAKNLYDYWGDRLYRELRDSSGIIVNLASKEYSKCIEKYCVLRTAISPAIFLKSKRRSLYKRECTVRWLAEKWSVLWRKTGLRSRRQSSISPSWDTIFSRTYLPRRSMFM